MERLTIDEIIEHCDRKTGMYEKTCDLKYLETEVMGNRIKEYWEHKQVAEYLRKLKDYEDLEEQGRLVKLPCKIGDIIYRVNAGAKEPVIKMIVLQVNYKQLREDRIIIRIDAMNDNDMGESCYLLADFGKNVSITKSEAEAKLKELEGGENESSN